MINHRTITAREDDALSRERERQQLREQLDAEQQLTRSLRQDLNESNMRLAEAKEASRMTEGKLQDAVQAKERLAAEIAMLSREMRDHSTVPARSEQHANDPNTHDLVQQLQDQTRRATEAIRLREDQSARLRLLESRLHELEMQETLHERATVPPPVTRREAFTTLHSVMGGPSRVSALSSYLSALTWNQWKVVLAAAVIVLFLLSLLNGFSTQASRDTDVAVALREKYAQALTATTLCREELALKLKGCVCSPPSPSH